MEVKIRVGASVDQSLRTAFRPLVQSAIEARRLITREFAQIPKEIGTLFAGTAKAQGAAQKAGVSEARAAARERVQAERDAAREIHSLQQFFRADARRAHREMAQEHAAMLRQMRAREREAARQRRMDARELDRFATRTSHRATRFLTPNIPIASIANRAFHGAMAGFGIDATFAGAGMRNIALEDAAVAFAKQARIAGQDVDPRMVEGRARGIQKRLGIDASEAIGGLSMFQKLAGDSKTGLELFEGMADRAATANIGMENVGSVMGNIAKALGDVPDKANRMLAVFDMLTAQGTKGAVEIEDMAKQIAKVTAPARLIEGDAGRNTMRLAAIAQISRDIGGSANAMQATTSITSLMNTFDKGARAKAFRDAGISLRGAGGLLRDPFELIKAAIVHTKGDSEKMNAFVMDAQAKRAVRGFLTEFNRAGGGAAGVAAMDKLMENYMSGNLTPETRQANMDLHLGKKSTQVAQFQAALDEVAAEVQGQLLPILREAQPDIIKFVKAMGDLAAWAVQNPGKAILSAILLSIARAGIESALRGAIERAIVNGLAGGPVGVGGKGGTGNPSLAVSRLQGAQNIMGAAAFMALGVGAAVDQANDLKKVTGSKSSLADILPGMKGGDFSLSRLADDLFGDVAALGSLARFKPGEALGKSGTARRFGAFGEAFSGIFNMDENLDKQARERFAKEQAEKAKREAEAKKVATSSGHAEGRANETVEQFMERFQAEFSQKKEERELIEGQKAMVQAITAGGGMKVKVTNFPTDDGGGGEDPAAPPPA